MRIVRFKTREGSKYGVLDDGAIRGIQGSPFDQFTGPGCSFAFDGTTYKLNEIKILAPCIPSKVVCVGMNHWSMIKEDMTAPETPMIFIKPTTAVIATEENIVFPSPFKNVGFEGELAVVIGRTAKNVDEAKAKEYILGYTCHNDVSDYDAIKQDGISMARGKARDTFAPLGPWIETDIDGENLKLESFLNGKSTQSGLTSDLIHSVSNLISFMSGVMTFLPGDVISTGTPKKSNDRLKHGDVIEIVIEGIGTLRNIVVQE
jgi:2-keto-4-pentenoate hydratase/2-oxohepta-3-ene-1,7-dioic acid hydratase in catechol pathway